MSSPPQSVIDWQSENGSTPGDQMLVGLICYFFVFYFTFNGNENGLQEDNVWMDGLMD